jgi:hypothetical protein
VSNTTVGHKMTDGTKLDGCRHYEKTKHFEFVNVAFHGGQSFVTGEYVFPGLIDAMLYWGSLTMNVRSQIPG